MTIKAHERLLLTGAAGGLGQALRERLKANCGVLRLSDRQDFGAAAAGEDVALATWLNFDDLHRLISACLSTLVLEQMRRYRPDWAALKPRF